MRRNVSVFVNGIMAGVLLVIGCAASMCAESKALGAFLFSLGLFAIITFDFGLYTGKAGYMALKPPLYIKEVILTFFGNATGTAIGGTLLHVTRFGNSFAIKASEIIDVKFSDNLISIFALAVFCGILMFAAVDGNRKCREKRNYAGALFSAVVPVMVFIVCSFNHCVADMAYFFISGCSHAAEAPVYFLMAVIGNAVGCMAIPVMKKLAAKK
ncbi:MAG: formate/nitrite transporter family protein [Clostridia bacterium]|nr:formate/nitrite transporter family protein [Clostridia bacterium]